MTAERPPRWGPTAYVAAVSALATSLVLARLLTWGMAWRADSVDYLTAARSLLTGNGLQTVWHDTPFTWWPPLYPLLLAAGGIFADPLEVAGPLNLSAFALTVFCFGHYLWARVDSLFLRVWAPLALALSLPLAESARFAMSETVFILLTTLALISVDKHLASGSWRTLVLTAVFSALAWQTRYLGVALAVTVGALVLVDGRRRLRERVKRLAVFSAITAAPMAVWAFRNYRLSGRPITNFLPVDNSLREALESIFGHLLGWTDFDRGPWTLAIVLSLALAAALARRRLEPTIRRTSHRSSSNPNLITVWGFFWLAYFVCLVAGMVLGATSQPWQPRYVTPLYIPTLAVLAGLCDRFLAPRAGGHSGEPLRGLSAISRIPRISCRIVFVSWLVGQAVPTAGAIMRANSNEFVISSDFTSARWARSETVDALRRPPSPPLPLRSNYAWAVSLHTGARGLYPMPKEGHEVAVEANLAEWLDEMPDGSRIVWFRRWERNGEYFAPTPLMLRVSPNLVPVGEFDDGTIFEVDRAPSPPMPSPLAVHFDTAVADSTDALLADDVFDLYVEGGDLWYFKEPCAPEDVDGRFHLTVTVPAVTETGWPAAERLDFDFEDRGILSEGRCLAVVPLPEEGYGKFETGQWWTNPWQVAGRLDRDRYRAALASWAGGEWGEPEVRAVFDLHHRENELRYVKKPCTIEDTEARFFLHIFPEDETDLPAGSREHGFINRDFDFAGAGFVLDDHCLAIAPLPESVGGRFRTGQFLPGGELWSAEAKLPPPP